MWLILSFRTLRQFYLLIWDSNKSTYAGSFASSWLHVLDARKLRSQSSAVCRYWSARQSKSTEPNATHCNHRSFTAFKRPNNSSALANKWPNLCAFLSSIQKVKLNINGLYLPFFHSIINLNCSANTMFNHKCSWDSTMTC